MLAQNPFAGFAPQNGNTMGFGSNPMMGGAPGAFGTGSLMSLGQQQQQTSQMMDQMMSMMGMVMNMMLMKQMTTMSAGIANFGSGSNGSGGSVGAPGMGNFLGSGGAPSAGGGGTATATPTGAVTGPIAGGGQGEAAVKWALSQEGISEASNMDVVKSYSQGRNEAWCAHFVSTALEKSGGSPFGHQASVAGILDWGKKNQGHFLSAADAKSSPNRLKVGDAVIWKQAGASHTGLVTGVNSDGTFSTIEGNTSDKVAKRTHKFSDGTLTGFVRPNGTF